MSNVVQAFHALKHLESVRVGVGRNQLDLEIIKLSIRGLGFRFQLGFHYSRGVRFLREANEVGTNTEASTRAGRGTDRRGLDIKNGERRQGDEGDHADLAVLQCLPREDEGGDGNGETLQGILDATGDEVRNVERRGRRRLGLGLHLFVKSWGENLRHHAKALDNNRLEHGRMNRRRDHRCAAREELGRQERRDRHEDARGEQEEDNRKDNGGRHFTGCGEKTFSQVGRRSIMPRELQTLPKYDEANQVIDYLEEDAEHPTQR